MVPHRIGHKGHSGTIVFENWLPNTPKMYYYMCDNVVSFLRRVDICALPGNKNKIVFILYFIAISRTHSYNCDRRLYMRLGKRVCLTAIVTYRTRKQTHTAQHTPYTQHIYSIPKNRYYVAVLLYQNHIYNTSSRLVVVHLFVVWWQERMFFFVFFIRANMPIYIQSYQKWRSPFIAHHHTHQSKNKNTKNYSHLRDIILSTRFLVAFPAYVCMIWWGVSTIVWWVN